jgi:mono/diheme cytochrome c family protein
MDKQEKQDYLERYQQAKEHGVPFFPDALFKDALVALLVFILLAALATLVGAPLEARADPADSSYTPRPEWYFLFLFQMLKYFPGSLEVVGVFVLPTLVILLLLMLPFIDRSAKRHFLNRPVITGVTTILTVAILLLTVQALLEVPPPAETARGDVTAALYAQNCASCHGPTVDVAPGANLHDVIAQGRHEGMPAWSGDLTTDQIDALAGFILSPAGSRLFNQNCGECHEASDLVAGDPLQLKQVIELGSEHPVHEGVNLPDWRDTLSAEARTALLNFLIAPDGQRLFVTNCAPCHGQAVAFSGDTPELRALILQGGQHLEMPPWRERLPDDQIQTLARYVVDPEAVAQGEALFERYCSDCHGERIPAARDVTEAEQIIRSGGPHETMPVWGEILTQEQLDALVNYTMEAARGTPLEVGRRLYVQNCATCHGDFGEGGLNPVRADDVIAPISSAEYLKTRDDATLRAIIAQGQPNFGMSPFSTAFGGPLDDEEIESIVTYLRSWERNPPVELPPEVAASSSGLSGVEVFVELCAQCHGPEGEGGIGPSLRDPAFQSNNSDQDIFDTINLGHEATAMIAWGEVLTSDQIQQLVEHIRSLAESTEEPTPAVPPSFSEDVLPIFEAQCAACHGTMGGWDGSSYETVMSTGENAPVVVPGDAANSLLAQKLLGTQEEGAIMPPSGKMRDELIQVVLGWIEAGAPED